MDTSLPWRRKAVYWSSISQTFAEQLKQQKHFADMDCVSTSGPGQAPPGSAEGLGHVGSSEVSPWASPRLAPSRRVSRPCLSCRARMLLQLPGHPELVMLQLGLSHGAALHRVRSGSSPSSQHRGDKTAAWGRQGRCMEPPQQLAAGTSQPWLCLQDTTGLPE